MRRAAISATIVLSAAVLPGSTQQPPPGGAVTPSEESKIEAPPVAGQGPVVVGKPMTAMVVNALRPGREKAEPLDLASDIGKRPVVFVYWLMQFPVSEDVMTEVVRFAGSEGGGKVAVYPIVKLGTRYEITELAERMRLLKIDVPVITDEDGRLLRALGVGTVPSIALIDATGVLCFTKATSLKQPVLSGADVAESIRIAGRGEEPPTVFGLNPYVPASDRIGENFRDFTLPDKITGQALHLADHVKPGRLTALLYWSPNCRFSRMAMPAFLTAYRSYHEKYLDLISVVRTADSDGVGTYASENKIPFPILQDKDHRFTALYRVVSTPTLILVRPDGVVDSVHADGRANFFTILQTKIHNLVLKPAPSPAGAAVPAPAKPGR